MKLSLRDKTGNKLTVKEVTVKLLTRIQNIILEFEVFLLHLAGNVPSHHFRRFFYRLAGIKIGVGSTIHMGTTFYCPYNITVGDDTVIGERVVLDGRDKLIIGSHTAIATEAMIYNSEHNINDEHFTARNAPVVIEDYVFIGPRAIILPGVTIKKGAVIGAGAVVTKNVSSYNIVGGVPAQVIGERQKKDLHYSLGRARWFR